jgi:putative FmdB family regulatory protein
MPTYEYECLSCKIRFDLFQSMKDDPISVCPECKGKVKRLIGGGLGVIFKGSGFYSTDHKKSAVTTGETSKADPPKDTKPTTENKSDKSEKKSA